MHNEVKDRDFRWRKKEKINSIICTFEGCLRTRQSTRETSITEKVGLRSTWEVVWLWNHSWHEKLFSFNIVRLKLNALRSSSRVVFSPSLLKANIPPRLIALCGSSWSGKCIRMWRRSHRIKKSLQVLFDLLAQRNHVAITYNTLESL